METPSLAKMLLTWTDAVARLMGEERPMRFTQLEKKGFFSKLFGG